MFTNDNLEQLFGSRKTHWMQDIPNRLDEIEIKIRQLIQENKRVRFQNTTLKAKLESIEKELGKRISQVNDLSKELENTKQTLRKGESSGIQHAKKTKKQIDNAVKKIDEFIELLQES